jgi:hypothetical protein
MKMRKVLVFLIPAVIFAGCSRNSESSKPFIMNATIKNTADTLSHRHNNIPFTRIEKGVTQVAHYWTKEDGTEKDFTQFCFENFLGTEVERDNAFKHISQNIESLDGNFNQITLNLLRATDLDIGPILPIDRMFAELDTKAHLVDDLFKSKIAFYIILNFPFYNLKEKNELGEQWSRKEWAYIILGDYIKSRVPADCKQEISKAYTEANMYISDYNIFIGRLLDKHGNILFTENKKLISHWGLRDEIKANYSDANGLEKQRLIYECMKHIVSQDIPEQVVNNDIYLWNPYTNKVSDKTKEIASTPEPDTRYKMILRNFKALKAADIFYSDLDTYIKRAFEQDMQMPQEEVEKLFTEFVSSPQVRKVAELIQKRLGRNLEPFDIWYDGFKPRSSYSNEKLDAITIPKYPDNSAFKKDMPNLLKKLDFTQEKALFIASKIDVDAARGSGHAWGSRMKDQNSHLRTRINSNGMNYKGYNIAVHEFGHTVEQTISMNDVDYYMLAGVPNTAFTEALAFIFQQRDLDLLGIKDKNPEKEYLFNLDIFWSLYEIMGVSLVDMNVWKWLYAHPEATPGELKKEVVAIATDTWNKYYAPVFGVKDQPLLAIYSHMISDPLYLSNYPIGHLVEFQIEQYIKGKSFAKEIERIYSIGSITPKEWMKKATGEDISIKPVMDAVDKALMKMNK